MAGQGSVYRRKSDQRWTAAISSGPRGHRTTIVRYAPPDDNTKRAALALLDELRRLAAPAPGRATVGSYLRAWLDTAGRRSLKPSTWRTYDSALRLHIEPAVGHLALSRLSGDHVDAMLATIDRSPKTQRNVLAFLGRVLDVAQRRGHVLRNAARLVELPRYVREEPRVLTVDEARRVLAAVRGDRLEALYVTAIATGMRLSEILGLRWSDVDLGRGRVTALVTLAREAGEYHLDDVKTGPKGRRPIALPEFAVAALREHRARQLEERVAAGAPTAEGLVFVAPTGRPLNAGWMSHHWPKVAAAAGVDVTFHQLRHTNATILGELGVAEDVRMRRLGHTTTAMARRYDHGSEATDRAAAAALQEALG